MSTIAERIQGRSLEANQFVVKEDTGFVNYAHVEDVLRGDLCAYVIHDFLPKEDCEKILNRFWESKHKIPRYGEGEGGVEAYLIGASHIEKTTKQYMEEAQAARVSVDELYEGGCDPIQEFKEGLIAANNNFASGRAAKDSGFEALPSKSIYWNNTGEFLLLPHDDLAQLSDPLQAGFEIESLKRVMAVNCYPAVPIGGGQLKVWNIEPDHPSREKLGLEHSGFPYPEESLEGIENLVISVKSGDLCVLNGNLIHAVLSGSKQTTDKNRLLLTCFMSFNQNNELLWWT